MPLPLRRHAFIDQLIAQCDVELQGPCRRVDLVIDATQLQILDAARVRIVTHDRFDRPVSKLRFRNDICLGFKGLPFDQTRIQAGPVLDT